MGADGEKTRWKRKGVRTVARACTSFPVAVGDRKGREVEGMKVARYRIVSGRAEGQQSGEVGGGGCGEGRDLK